MFYQAPEPSKLPPLHAEHPLFNPSTAPSWKDEFFGQYALVAQALDFNAVHICEPSQLDDEELQHERHTLVTHDEASLDTLEIRHVAQQLLETRYQTFIINFNCNFKAYEQSLDELQEHARTLQTNVIGFNYRGVGQSQGRVDSMHHLILDGIAQVQRLLDRGVSPENITLSGLSIGGATATCVAWYFHKQGMKLNLFNDRSFASSMTLVLCHVENIPIIGGLLCVLLVFILSNSAWDFSIIELFQEIPEPYKEYILVRTPEALRTVETQDDLDIPHESSLHFGFKAQRRQIKGAIDVQIAELGQEATIDEEILSTLRETRHAEKEKARNRKMEVSVATVGEDRAHTLPKKYLYNREGVSADTFFNRFVQSTHEDHGVKSAVQVKAY